MTARDAVRGEFKVLARDNYCMCPSNAVCDEVIRLRKIEAAAVELMAMVSELSCAHFDHRRHQYHEYDEPCPCAARYKEICAILTPEAPTDD